MTIRHPLLVRHARYRWDELRGQHQLLFPEGMLVLNETGAAIVRLCDGRPVGDLLAALCQQFADRPVEEDVFEFIERLAKKGLIRDVDS
jgi:pyrroloquinoline quinone biosynthesis protein D